MKPSFTNVISAAGWGAAGELLAGEPLGRQLQGPAWGRLLRPCWLLAAAALRRQDRGHGRSADVGEGLAPQVPAAADSRQQITAAAAFPTQDGALLLAPQLSGSPASCSPAFWLPSLLPPTHTKKQPHKMHGCRIVPTSSGCFYGLRKLRGIQI